jgi:hypothetical protein
MRKLLCLVAVLGFVSAATAADGRIFITAATEPYGLTHSENACIPTFSAVDINNVDTNAYDYYYGTGPFVVGAYPPAGHPGYTCQNPLRIDCTVPTAPKYAYIWLQFDSSVPKGTKINGLEITSYYCDTNQPTPDGCGVYYLCNDMGAGGSKRWNGTATPPNYPELTCRQPQVLVAVTAFGIQKLNLAKPSQMWSGMAEGSIALLGAICCEKCNNCDAVPRYLKVTNVSYENWTGGSGIFDYQTGYVCIPEPAGLLLLGLAGLLRRR